MKRQDKFPETETFHYFNKNSLGRITTDCTIRSVAIFLNISWEEALRQLADFSIGSCVMFNDTKGLEKFLNAKGYKKQPQPRREDGTKYTAAEFCKEIARFDKRYILSLAGHDTAVVNCKVFDTWDCTEKSVGNYYIAE